MGWQRSFTLGVTEDIAASLVGVCQAGEAREHLHMSPVADHRSLGLLSSLCFQVWPTELSTMMWMPCVTYVSSSTTCPSVARIQLRSASAMTQGGWQRACPSLAFWHLYPDRISGQLGAGCRVCQQGPSCGEVAGIWGQEQSLVISSLPSFWLWGWKRLQELVKPLELSKNGDGRFLGLDKEQPKGVCSMALGAVLWELLLALGQSFAACLLKTSDPRSKPGMVANAFSPKHLGG